MKMSIVEPNVLELLEHEMGVAMALSGSRVKADVRTTSARPTRQYRQSMTNRHLKGRRMPHDPRLRDQ